MDFLFEISDLEEIREHIDDILGSHLTPFHVEGRMAISPLGMRSVFQQTVGQMDMAQTVPSQEQRFLMILTQLSEMALIKDKVDVPKILFDLHDQFNAFVCGAQEALLLEFPIEVFKNKFQEIILV